MRAPVVATTAVAVPLITLVPMKQTVGISVSAAGFSGAALRSSFSTGSDSPVSALWLTNRSFAAIRRTSAGTMSPAER